MMPSHRGSLHSNTRSRFDHGSISYVVAVGATLAALGLSRLAFNVVGNRAFGIALVGKANLLLSMALLVGLPASAGLGMAISRFFPIYIGTLESWRSLRSSIVLTVVSVLIVLVPALAISEGIRHIASSPLELTVVALWAVLYALYAVGRALIFAQGRVLRVFALEVLGLGAFFLGLLVAARRNELWWLPFTAYPLPVAISSVISTIRQPPQGKFADRSRFFRFAGLALLGSAAGQGVQYGSTIACGMTGGTSIAGAWATLVSVGSPALLLPRSLSTSYLPKLAGLSVSAGQPFVSAAYEHQRLSAVLALPAVLVLLFGGASGLPLALSGNPSADVLVAWNLLCLMTFVTCRSEPILTGIAALGFAGINAAAAMVGAALCAATWVVVNRHHPGLVAISAGLLVYASAVPIASSLIARYRLIQNRPRLIFQPGDFVLLLVAGLLFNGGTSNRRYNAALAISAACVVFETWRYFRHRSWRFSRR